MPTLEERKELKALVRDDEYEWILDAAQKFFVSEGTSEVFVAQHCMRFVLSIQKPTQCSVCESAISDAVRLSNAPP